MNDTTMDQKLCSGFGQLWSSKAGKQYAGITLREIEEMSCNPVSVEKQEAQWALMSSRMSRVFDDQLQNGLFWALWVDVDEAGGVDFQVNFGRAFSVLKCYAIGYTSRSSTKENQKFRLIIPLAAPVVGATWKMLSKILNDMLSTFLEPDRASERTAQLCYLPNRGEYYDHAIHTAPLLHPDSWAEELEAERLRLQEVAEHQARAREAARLKAIERMRTGMASPVDAFNAEYDLEMLLDQYGYLRRGNRWLSPNSGSGQAGVEIKDGGKWFSAHASDSGIGKPTSTGSMGDAFDLFVFYEHGNDMKAALRAAGDMFTTDSGETLTKASQREFVQRQSAEKAMGAFEDLTLSAPGQPPHDIPGDPGPTGGPVPGDPAPAVGCPKRPNRFQAHAITGPGILERFVSNLKESWRVKKILPTSSTLAEIYGPPDRYKSFLILDMGCCISVGIPYHGHATTQCHVLYVAAEGQAGILKRLVVWMRYHGIDHLEHFTLLPVPCLLDHDDDLRDLIGFIGSMPEKPGVVIVDTLARSMMGDENSTRDMNKVVHACTMLTEATGVQVVLVHHTGKDTTKGSRGSIALEGATDTQFEVMGNKSMTATMVCKRMKDNEKCPPMTFQMQVEATGYVSEDGEIVTSLVPVLDQEAQAAGIAAKGSGITLSGAKRVAYEALKEGTRYQKRLHVDAWRELSYRKAIAGENTSTDAKSKAFRRAVSGLHDFGFVDCEDDHWWTT